MILAGLAEALTTRWLGRPLELLEEHPSTNDRVAELARAGAPAGEAVIADRQTRGRGRLGRAWQSPAGANLYLSFLLRPDARKARELPPLALACGLGVCEAAERFGVAARLKWPNDVLGAGPAGARGLPPKLAGVLLESASAGGTGVLHVVCGIGLNVNQREFPPELAGVAGSLALERGQDLPRVEVAAALLGALEGWIDRFFAEGPAAVVAGFRDRAFGLGAEVEVRGGATPVRGRLVDLAPDGALLVDTGARAPARVVAGELVLV